MQTAAAMVFYGHGEPLQLQRFSIPSLREREVLIRVTACTLCGSDVHSFTGRRSVPVPTVLGHEIIGYVEAFGPRASAYDAAGEPLALGDRVTWAIVANCGECFYCRRDLPAKCQMSVKFGHEPLREAQELTGGLAEYVVLPQGTSIFRLPNDLADEVACPANCATATTAAVLEAAGRLDGRAVLVLGAGMLGITACAMSQAAGASAVICCDVSAERRQLALRFGATSVAPPEELAAVATEVTRGFGVDAFCELSGSTDALETAIPLLRLGGTAVLAGAVFPTRAMQLEPERVVRRNLTLRGIHNYAPRHLQSALRFLEANRTYPFASLVSSWMPLEATEQAFIEARSTGAYRIGIRPSRPADH